MIKFKTESGSEYEMEWGVSCLHATKVKGTPTERQTPGRMMLNTDEPVVGEPYIMIWGVTDEGVLQTTITSPVTEVTYA